MQLLFLLLYFALGGIQHHHNKIRCSCHGNDLSTSTLSWKHGSYGNHQYFLQWVILHVKIDFTAYIILNIKNLKNTHDWFNFIIFHLKIWATGKAYTCINLTQKVWLLIIKLQFNGTCIHALSLIIYIIFLKSIITQYFILLSIGYC